VKESQEIKSEANQLFVVASYDQAISCYDRALASCPNYLDYDVAVIHSNIAACHLKLEAWKSAVDSATVSLDRLEKIIPTTSPDKNGEVQGKEATKPDGKDTEDVIEISGDDEDAELEELQRLKEQDELRGKVLRLRAKVLMRRAKAKSQIGGWGSLQGAAEDYQALVAIENISADDKRIAQRALRELPARITQAREKEMGDMMGKLKDVSSSP
jgi:tetratricopeptide (TPR) repeat protein